MSMNALSAALIGGGAPPPAPDAESPAGYYRQILELIGAAQQVERDDVDLLQLEKARTLFQTLLANQQREEDDLIQGRATPRALRRNA